MNNSLPNPSERPVPLDDDALAELVQRAMVRAGLAKETSPTLTEAENSDPVVSAMAMSEASPDLVPDQAPFSLPVLPSLAPQVFGIGATILFCIALTAALVVLEPPRLVDAFDPFTTPLHVIPEWYLLPAFGIVLAAPTKLVGIGALTGLLVVLFGLPVLPKVEKLLPGSYWALRGLFILIHIGVAVVGYLSMGA